MATGERLETGGSYPTRQPSRWKRDTGLLVLLALAIVLAFGWSALRARAVAATSYGAQVACQCRHVSNLPLASCMADVRVGGHGRITSLVTLDEEPETRTVTASVPLLARQSANYSPARGCQLEPWDD